MMGINFLGSYSGIDSMQIDRLMEVEKLPLAKMNNKKLEINRKKDAWKDINTRLNSLYKRLEDLQNPKLYEGKKTTSSQESQITASADFSAVEGTYNIKIDQIATKSRYISARIDEDKLSKAIGDGKTLIIKSGDYSLDDSNRYNKNSFSIKIEKYDSLKDIARKINSISTSYINKDGEEVKGSGIKAIIVDKRLVLQDINTGPRYIDILDGEDSNGFSQIFKDNEYGLEKGKEAIFSINGIKIKRDTNIINDVIEGVTLKLKQKTDKNEVIKVEQNIEKIEKVLKEFVDQYNSTIDFISSKLDPGTPDIPGSRGELSGDSSLIRLEKSIRSLVTAKVGSNFSIKDISELGLTTIDKSGKLKFDSSKLKKLMKENQKGVKEFFISKTDEGDLKGYVEKVNEVIDEFISTKNGIVKIKNESFDRSLNDLNKQIEIFSERMERKEKYYMKIFSKLDIAMMQAESQIAWLEGQMNLMNSQRK